MVTSRAHRTVQVAATQAWRQAFKWTCDITYYSYKDISKSNLNCIPLHPSSKVGCIRWCCASLKLCYCYISIILLWKSGLWSFILKLILAFCTNLNLINGTCSLWCVSQMTILQCYLFVTQRPLRCEAGQWRNITICCAVLSAAMRLVLCKNQEINDLPSCVIANNNTKIASINTHYWYTFHLGIKY